MKILLAAIFLLPATLFTQISTDSLRSIWQNESLPDSLRMKATQELSFRRFLNSNPDSARYYATLQLNYAERKGLIRPKADAIGTFALLLNFEGDYNGAIEKMNESLALFRSINDKKGMASQLGNIAVTELRLGKYTLAESIFEECFKLYSELDDSLGMARTLNNSARLYSMTSDYERAIANYNESISLFNAIGVNQGIGTAYLNLGVIYHKLGNYEFALDYYDKCLANAIATGDLRMRSGCLGAKGRAHSSLGDLHKALLCMEEGIKIKKQLGDREGIADALTLLGALYRDRNDYLHANQYFQEAFEVYESIGLANGIVIGLNNLANIHVNQNRFSEARSCLERSRKLCDTIHNSRGKFFVFSQLAAIEILDGSLDSAKKLCDESFLISSSLDFKQGQSNALSLLSHIALMEKDYSTALDYSMRALDLAKQIGHVEEIRDASRNIFIAQNAAGQINEASQTILSIIQLRYKDLERNFGVLSERDQELYFQNSGADFDRFYSFGLTNKEELPEITAALFDHTLIAKGILLKSSTALRNTILHSGDTVLIKEYNEWLMLKRQITAQYAEGKDVGQLEAEAYELEKELVLRSRDFSDAHGMFSLSWKDVQHKLSESEAAVEFVRFSDRNGFREDSVIRTVYAALIVTRDCKYPSMIRLFEEYELEKIIGSFPGSSLTYIEQLYGTQDNVKSQLYNLIWKPMEAQLKDVTKIYLSPAGLLHKISFNALAREQDVLLCDIHGIQTESSVGNIVHGNTLEFDGAEHVTIFGGINYNAAGNTSDQSEQNGWQYLDGSLTETQKIETILKKSNHSVDHYSLSEATEEQFKSTVSGADILHVATHGFFYPHPDDFSVKTVDTLERDLSFRGGTSSVGVHRFVKSLNPLMRSGLVFAGANDVWSRTSTANDTMAIGFENVDSVYREDGVLTAQEVATIDMRKTQLVVLSACETGLGDIKGSEGVYGLQRAFKMAGVKYIIMSLWQVPDKETAEFMTTFYKNLTKTADIRESFNLTQQTMRAKYDPYYWGAFVLIE